MFQARLKHLVCTYPLYSHMDLHTHNVVIVSVPFCTLALNITLCHGIPNVSELT